MKKQEKVKNIRNNIITRIRNTNKMNSGAIAHTYT